MNELSLKDKKIQEYEFETKKYLNNIEELEQELSILKDKLNKETHSNKDTNHKNNMQINFDSFEKDNLINTLSETDILILNPMEAMNMLNKIEGEAKKLVK